MPEHEYPPDDERLRRLEPRFDHLFTRSELSLSPDTAAYELRRTFAITILVNDQTPGQTEEIYEEIRRDIDDYLAKFDFQLFEERWGPIDGSKIITLFGETKEPVTGDTFQGQLRHFSELISHGLKKVSKYGYALLIVGNLGILYLGEAQVVKDFPISPQVVHMIVVGNTAAGAAKQLKGLFGKESGQPPK